jgi:hypothetical protein
MNEKLEFGEVQFFFCIKVGNEEESFPLISHHTAPDVNMLTQSHRTLWSCKYQAETALDVISVNSIISVVGMVPQR